MKLIDQDIPAELYRAYERSLGFAQEYKEGSGIFSIKKRQPYNLPHMQSKPKRGPSAAQLAVRATFLKCVDCFNKSPRTGGVVPPDLGYRSREWWYQRSLDLPAPNIKRTEMVTWAGYPMDPYQLKDTNYDYHDANWFLKTDEQDFIDFYDEMKIKWGYPWSPINSPDQIITRMNQIVCVEITYDHEGDMSVCFTPGQTAQARKGVCDDQSALHYALTWKALKELGWTDEDVDNRLSCVINEREDNGHIYNWWRSNAGGTRIVENTYNLGNMPLVIGDMQYWGADAPKYLTQRFNKTGHYEPVWTYPEITLPLWYYNYFIKYSWPIFWDDDVPDWCIAFDHWVEVAPQLDGETRIYSLAEFNGKLYGGTYDHGRLYEWNGTDAWVEKAPKLGTQSGICALAVFNNKLYGSTGFHGRLYEWNGINAWVEKVGYTGTTMYMYSLVVFNNKLYGGALFSNKLREWSGTDAWIYKAAFPSGDNATGFLQVFNGKLYAGGSPAGRLYEWNGIDAWIVRAEGLGGLIYYLSSTVFNGKLYTAGREDGKLYEWNGTNAWVIKADPFSGDAKIWSLAVYMDKIYAGTGINGKLLEWNGTDAWVEKAPKLGDETVIRSMLVFGGKLYGGTQPHGKLYMFT